MGFTFLASAAEWRRSKASPRAVSGAGGRDADGAPHCRAVAARWTRWLELLRVPCRCGVSGRSKTLLCAAETVAPHSPHRGTGARCITPPWCESQGCMRAFNVSCRGEANCPSRKWGSGQRMGRTATSRAFAYRTCLHSIRTTLRRRRSSSRAALADAAAGRTSNANRATTGQCASSASRTAFTGWAPARRPATKSNLGGSSLSSA